MKSFFSFFVTYIVPASTLLPIGAGFIYYKKINKPLRTLLLYLVLAFLINVAGTLMAVKGINNLPLLHVYTMMEVVTITLYFKYAFDHPKTDKWATAIMILFPLLCIINFSFFQSIYTFNTYTRPLGALICIVFSAIYLAYQNSLVKPNLITASGRIVAGGFLLYFCSSIFQFIFSNVVHHTTPKYIVIMIWNIHATFVFIMYLFFLRAILNGRNNR